jgi:hypothetical protein
VTWLKKVQNKTAPQMRAKEDKKKEWEALTTETCLKNIGESICYQKYIRSNTLKSKVNRKVDMS